MKHLLFVLSAVCILTQHSIADDTLHPYSPSIRSGHASLAPDSPKWFRPGYGYATPYSRVLPPTAVPYLSLKADSPFEPYTLSKLQTPLLYTQTYNRAGRVWPVPGDVKGIRIHSLRRYGNLPLNSGFAR